MSAQDVFTIVGLSLVALALIVSFIGLRMESFPPSRGAMLAGIGLFAAVIGVTVVFAWSGAEDEQSERDAKIASGEEPSPAEVVAEMRAGSQAGTEEGEGETSAEAQGDEPATASADGAALFEAQGCSGCHTLKAAGSTGTTGPDLDQALQGADQAFIEESIADPEKVIEEGFPGGVMPDDYEEVLSPEEFQAIVQFVAESVGVKG